MRIKLLTIVLCILLILLAACSSDNQNPKESSLANKSISTNENSTEEKNVVVQGYIVRKSENLIRVMPEITKEEIMGKNREGLEAHLRENYEGEGYTVHLDVIDEKTKSSLHIGQKVVVTCDWLFLTEPLSGTALEIRIVEE